MMPTARERVCCCEIDKVKEKVEEESWASLHSVRSGT